MTSTSSVSSSASTSTGNAVDVSSITNSSYSLSLADAVTVKVQPYLDRADVISTQISTNKTQISAYQTMQTLLQALETATSNLSSQALEGSNVFSNRAAGLTSQSAAGSSVAPSDASVLMSASVASGTAAGTHTVQVNQLAASQENVSLSLASTGALGLSGSFTIAETGKTALNISVNSNMTLNDIASAINGDQSNTGVTASIVSIGNGTSVLVISGADTDQALQVNQVSGNVLDGLGLNSSLTGTSTANTAALGLAGTFTITGGIKADGTEVSVPVTITSAMTLTQISDAINSAASTAGVSGTMATVNGGALSLSSGSGSGIVGFSDATGNVLSGLGVTAISNQVTAAQPASLTIDGVSGILRSTNTVSDALTGVTLNLKAADPNTVVTLKVQPDTTTAANTIAAFVTAYNNWESFVQQNEATNSDGSAASGAVLFGDATLRETSLAVDNVVTSTINNMSLAGIGISLNNDNTMSIDSSTLVNALTENFTGVVSLFQSQMSTNSSTLLQAGTDYSTFAGNLAMQVTTDGTGKVTSVSVSADGGTTWDSSAFTIGANGHTLSGAGVYSGMVLTYNGGSNTTATVSVSATQGLANQLYTKSKNYGNTLNGTVQGLINNLQSEDTSLTNQYNSIISQANDYTTFLLAQYATLTTQVETAGYTSTVLNEMFAMQTKG